jgi:hypothetical protein
VAYPVDQLPSILTTPEPTIYLREDDFRRRVEIDAGLSPTEAAYRRTLRVLAFVLAIVSLIVVASFGMIVALVYRGRSSSFSYFDCGMRELKEKAQWRSRAMD